jgi:glycosyltransferase involved in cell wall biosynthesis
MIIAVNTRLRKEGQPAGYEDFMFELLDQVTRKNPQHQFLYIFDKAFDEKRSFAKNVVLLVAGPETKTNLRLQYWFNYKIPAILRKHKADVFVSMEGICSLRTKKPQCLLISDLAFLQYPQSTKKSDTRFYKKNTAAFLSKAKTIATVSDHARSIIADKFKINAAGIAVISPGVDDIFKSIDWEEKETIKENYTEGKAYFLFSGDTDQRSNLINLLKAFSFFKKRQKSNMLLLVAGHTGETFKKELKTYKYRNEVLLLENLSKAELAKITAAAYAMVYPVLFDDLALPALQAMQCEVPLVISNIGALPSICGNAALYADPGSFTDIAENMMLVFKDEHKATSLVQAGKELVQQYRWDRSADLLMQSILKAVDK